jgi:hypothetical protein
VCRRLEEEQMAGHSKDGQGLKRAVVPQKKEKKNKKSKNKKGKRKKMKMMKMKKRRKKRKEEMKKKKTFPRCTTNVVTRLLTHTVLCPRPRFGNGRSPDLHLGGTEFESRVDYSIGLPLLKLS